MCKLTIGKFNIISFTDCEVYECVDGGILYVDTSCNRTYLNAL